MVNYYPETKDKTNTPPTQLRYILIIPINGVDRKY